ncbi:MAG: DUF4391 domain-containing protein [Propionibacterium sp.]|nr:DUF4391 domain-containing protein [Propionibacterium sp.]
MTDLLYQWPTAARVGRRVPKEKFYEHATVNGALRAKFVSEVARVTWEYKLAEATINLPDSDEVPEIQVFQVDTKSTDVSDHVLAAIDKAIQSPIIFEVTREAVEGTQVRMVAAHKQLSAGAPKISQYFTTGWHLADTDRQPLPTAITLPALYAALLEPLTDVAIRPGEGMSEVADRLKNVDKLKREIKALERKLHAEKQFNRKIELRRTLKTKQAQLTVLTQR